jgi:hypothetical protein
MTLDTPQPPFPRQQQAGTNRCPAVAQQWILSRTMAKAVTRARVGLKAKGPSSQAETAVSAGRWHLHSRARGPTCWLATTMRMTTQRRRSVWCKTPGGVVC